LAGAVAKSLVLSNLGGHDSHGIIRIVGYSGWVQTAAALATKTVIDSAGQLGGSTVVLSRTNHVGRLGEYVDEMANTGFGNGTLIMAIDISQFVEPDLFRNVLRQFAVAVPESNAPTGPKVLLPIQLEVKTKRDRLLH
jgi:LDH2 family malate/lactate/ureidoglycolate dehydrogenase